MNIVILTCCGVLAGIAGSLGIGGGGVLIIFLTVFLSVPQLAAQGTNLLFFLPIAMLSLAIYAFKHEVRFKTAVFIALCGLFGVVGGAVAAYFIGGKLLRPVFGAILFLLGVTQLFSKKRTEKNV